MLAHVPTVIVSGVDPIALAAIVLAGGFGTIVLATLLAYRLGWSAQTDVPFRRWIAVVVAGLSLGAGSIHVAVVDAHFAEYPPYGVAFAALAGFQVMSAVAYLFAPDRLAALAAIVVNAGALMVWAASRSVGLPFGPESELVEPIGALDLTASVLEGALIGVLAWDLGVIGRHVRPALTRAGAAVVLGSVTLGVALLTTTAFAAGGDPHGGTAHHVEQPVAGSPSASPPGATPSAAGPLDLAVVDPTIPAPPGSPSAAPPSSPSAAPPIAVPPTVIPATAEPSVPAAPSRLPEATRRPRTPVPATPKPAPTAPPVISHPGEINFGTSLGQDGAIAMPATQFRAGQRAVWIADFAEAPNTPTVRLFIVQVLPDGREFEHWREDIAVSEPAARRLVGGADLSIYLHGGDGRHVMRYTRGDTLLAEGEFELIH